MFLSCGRPGTISNVAACCCSVGVGQCPARDLTRQENRVRVRPATGRPSGWSVTVNRPAHSRIIKKNVGHACPCGSATSRSQQSGPLGVVQENNLSLLWSRHGSWHIKLCSIHESRRKTAAATVNLRKTESDRARPRVWTWSIGIIFRLDVRAHLQNAIEFDVVARLQCDFQVVVP